VSEHESARDEDGGMKLLATACAAVVGALLWVLIILAVRWVLELPPPALIRLSAVVLLFAGSAVVLFALAQVELTVAPSPDETRGRRPDVEAARREATPPVRPPSRGVDASTRSTLAGGRALHEVRPS
jgi:hypothetical protein